MTEIHPEAQAVLDRLSEERVPPAYTLSPRGAREVLNDLLLDDEPPEPVGRVQDLTIDSPVGGLPVRVYEPSEGDGPYPVLLYYHGGGWVRGSVDTHDDLLRSLCREIGCLVIGVDYHRAPEHPFPAAADDAYAALEWAAANVDEVGGDPDRIALAGDSAGGNLTAATTLRARDEDGPDVAHQVLLYPVTDHAFDTDSYEANADNELLPRATMQWYWDHYLDRPLDGHHPYASPLRAPDHSGLPPATVITAGFDPLRDEGEAYAETLAAAGVDVEYTDYADMIHAFLNFPDLDRAKEARAQVVERLEAALFSE
ncbi:MAG: alpha/beta hydrolase [Halopenitus sp.]